MSSTWAKILAGSLLLLGLCLATPLGPWAAGHLLVRLAPAYGWQLDIGPVSGSLLGGMRFAQVRARGVQDGLEIEVVQLGVSLWPYSVELDQPQVVYRTAAVPDTQKAEQVTAPAALSLDRFPAVQVRHGRFAWVQPDSLQVRVDSLEAHYEALSDTLGRLSLSAARCVVRQGERERVSGSLAARADLEPRRVLLTQVELEARADSLAVRLEGQGQLRLVKGLPLELRVGARGLAAADSLEVRLAVDAAGDLIPVRLRVGVSGESTHPAWGPGLLRAGGTVDAREVQVDSLLLGLFGGELTAQGRYCFAADSLDARVDLAHLDLARLPGSTTNGVAKGRLAGSADLAQCRYAAQLDLEVAGLEVLPGKPCDFHLLAGLQPDRTASAQLRCQFGRLQATGQWAPDGAYELALSGQVEPAVLLDRPVEPVHVEGWARPDSLQLFLTTARLPLEGFGPARLDLSLRSWRFLEAVLALEESRTQLRLRADLRDSRIESFTGDIPALSLERLSPQLAGTAHGEVEGQGWLRPAGMRLSGDLALQGLGYAGWNAAGLSLHVEYHEERASCSLVGEGLRSELVLDTRDQGCEGWVEFSGARFQRAAPAGAPADSAGLVELTGRLQWKGALDRLAEAQAQLDLAHLSLRQAGLEVSTAAPLRVGYQGRRLSVGQAQFSTPVGQLRIAGQARTDSLGLRAEIPRLSLASLLPDLAGNGWARLETAGSLDRPQVRGDLELAQLSLAGRPCGDLAVHVRMADSLTAELSLWQDRAAAVDQGASPNLDLRLDLPAAPLLADGLATATEGMHLAVAARQVDLQALLSYLLADSVSGQLSFDGRLSAPVALLADPSRWVQAHGQLRFEQLRLGKEGLSLEMQAGAVAELADGRLVLREVDSRLGLCEEGEQVRPAGRLTLGGEVASDGPGLLTLGLHDLDLGVLGRLGRNRVELTAGTADLQARLSGTVGRPDLQATLHVATEDLGRLDSRFHGTAQGGSADVSWTTLMGDSLQVRAELPWDLQRGTAAWEQGRLQARAEGLQLGALLDLFPFLEGLQGTLRVDLSVDGLAAVPRIHGGVEVADLRLRLLDTKPDYLFSTGRLVFDGSRGEFRDFVGRPAKGEGRIEVSGFVAAETATQLAYDVQVRAENLPYLYEDIFNAPDIDAEIAMRSTPTGGLLKGSARLSRALAEPELIDLTAPSLPPPPAAVQNPFLEHMELDVFVDVRDLRVNNELADLRLEGGVTAYGTFYKPRFQGGLEVTEGKAFVLNREFSFKKGRISLDRLVPTYSILDLAYDPLLLNPDLDLELGTTVKPIEETEGDYQVTLRLQGPVQEVAPEFSSEPSLGDTEILTLLAFGSTSPANYREALYTAAGQLLLSKQVEKIGLDEFQVLPSGTVLNTVGQPSVRMSKHFAFPVPLWVRYEAATAKPAFGELRLEYKLTSYLTLTGAAQSEYDRYGLGLGLKKDF